MPITYVIHLELRLVVTRFAGRVTDVEFVDLYSRLMADPDYELGTNELADLRKVESLDLSAAGLRRVEEITEERYAGSDASFRTAILAPRDHPYGIGRMYEAFSEEGPENVSVCRDPESALAWLELDPDVIDL